LSLIDTELLLVEVWAHIPLQIQLASAEKLEYELIGWDSESKNGHFQNKRKRIGISFGLDIKLSSPHYTRQILERNELGQIIKAEASSMVV